MSIYCELIKAVRNIKVKPVADQISLFDEPVELTGGETKEFGEGDTRKFDSEKHRWVDSVEVEEPKIEVAEKLVEEKPETTTKISEIGHYKRKDAREKTETPKSLKDLHKILMSDQSLNYNNDAKEHFGRTGKRALKELAQKLGLKDSEVSYNKGGVAVSGDLHLKGMFDDQHGFDLFFNKDFSHPGNKNICIRRIKNFKDYQGGVNNWITEDELIDIPKFKKTAEEVSGVPYDGDKENNS
jgi:hypothetical protein